MIEFKHYSEYRKTNKVRKCWLCCKPIEIGSRYLRNSGVLNGKWFDFPTCANTCDIVHEVLDQNPTARPRVFYPTLSEYEEGKN